MDNLDEMISRYTDDKDFELIDPESQVVSLSARIALRSKIKLEMITLFFEKKQTPLLGEILEASINEIFGKVVGREDFSEDLYQEFVNKMMEAGFRKGFHVEYENRKRPF